ncbi:MAG: GH1 family beta-glucosidase [Dictyoglomaceae bacterium]|nr:GH1 family beta-glucosidase [Dictyoglomaceae bacterium]HPU43940.1 GH1 family beta-glucosidase [Dictyoglomaceae bacterium]
MAKLVFPKDFLWGTATASYQIEGAAYEDGKGESIWDRFSHTPGTIYQNQTGDVASDHYHHWEEDVELMSFMGLKSYRFSISWPRIFPEGKGSVNPKGVAFYENLVEALLSKGIKPAITLYHWDLPQALEDKGGWLNRDTSKYFAEYANFMFDKFGDRVPIWITLNEPWVNAFIGYAFGAHAPGKRDMKGAFIASHNFLLAHGLAVQSYRQKNYKGEIGITLNFSPVYPATEKEEDLKAARLQDAFSNRLFLDPIFFRKYPEELWRILERSYWSFKPEPEDFDIISRPIDFIGINYYTRTIVQADPENKIFGIKEIKGPGEFTDMDWEIYPDGLYDLLIRLYRDYEVPLYITENGAAFSDVVEDGKIRDKKRIDYLREHFKRAYYAIRDGVDLRGYFIWTLMDNFEWSNGFSKRFGLIYVDYSDQKRILKDSAYFYKEVIANNGLEE